MMGLHALDWATATDTAGGIDPTMNNPRAKVPATLDANADADTDKNVLAPSGPSAPPAGGPDGKSKQMAGDVPGAAPVRGAIGNWPDPM
ncbi:MAG: hypothetical protein QOH40_1347 [Arthrobacter pascens]|jgi:hypothetical protein|nr:hypothetical protein [Arthrobacter pascens]